MTNEVFYLSTCFHSSRKITNNVSWGMSLSQYVLFGRYSDMMNFLIFIFRLALGSLKLSLLFEIW